MSRDLRCLTDGIEFRDRILFLSMTNIELAHIIRRALVRLQECPRHDGVLVPHGRPCIHCLLELWTGREVLTISQIMER